jgi:hypothetical protein
LKEEEKKGVKPEKLTSTFAKLMRQVHSSPFDPQPLPNNLAFLDAHGSVESVYLAKKSKETFKNRGYVDGDPGKSLWMAIFVFNLLRQMDMY